MTLRLGNARLDLRARELKDLQGQTLLLRPQSFEVLALLAKQPDEILSREEIFDAVWPGVAVTDDSLTQCIADIRKAIGDTDRTVLRTVPKKGYQLVAAPAGRIQSARKTRAVWFASTGAGVAALLLIATFFAPGLWSTQTEPNAADRRAPSIIVLPFRDLSPDASLAHFADGMTEDLITGLSQWKEFQIVDRSTAMTFKGGDLDIRGITARTQTNYALEGSIRRIAGTMRVTAQLVDGATGRNLWADQFDETGTDILAIHDGIVRRIEQSLIGNHGEVRADEYRESWSKSSVALNEYDYMLRGHSIFYEYTPESMVRALDIWREGLEKYPASGLLKIKEGWGRALCNALGCSYGPFNEDLIYELAIEGFEDRNLPPSGVRFGLWLLARQAHTAGDKAATLKYANAIANTYPSDVEGLLWSAMYLARVDANDDAVAQLERAGILDMRPMPVFYEAAAVVYAAAGDCAAAKPYFVENGFPEDMTLYAGCLSEWREDDKARSILKDLQERFDIRTPADLVDFFPHAPEVRARIENQLAKVGWPFASDAQPSIAVMPFTDITGEPRWRRLGEGLALEISNELARNRWLDVRAPYSAQQVADLKGLEAAKELDVAMLLDGTLQSDGDTLRVTARLTSAQTRSVIWSDKWSRPLNELFAIQDEILEQISGSLSGHFTGAIAMRGRRDIGRKPTNSISAYEHHLLASQAKERFVADGYAKCIDHSEEAIRIDPDYAQAWALMGLCEFWFAPFAESAEEKAAFFERAVNSVDTALRLDPNDPVALWSATGMGSDDLIVRRDYIRRAVKLAPNNADILASGAWVAGFVGITGPEPLRWVERALALNPTPPPWYHIANGVAAYQAGEDLLAVEAFKRAPRMTESLLFHAAAEWRLGNVEIAKSLILDHVAMAPDKTLVDHFGAEALTRPDLEKIRQMAVELGLPLSLSNQ